MSQTTQRAFTAYLIDPERRTIKPVDMPGGPDNLQHIYKLLGCNLITSAAITEHDAIYCDDEGLIKGPVAAFFGVQGNPQPLAGRGLVVGLDADGHDEAPQLTLSEVQARTIFIERMTKDMWWLETAASPKVREIGTLEHVMTRLAGEVCHG